MNVTCPTCDAPLHPTRLEHDLPALGCEECRGTLLSLVSWRSWHEHAPVDPPPEVPDIEQVGDSTETLRCPKCKGFMTKYRVAADAKNRIDLCTHCDEVWLDRGEWELLEQFAASDKLAHVFSEPWQNRVRTDEVRRRLEDRWRERLGAESYEKARTLRTWLAQHPKGKDLLAYLYLSQTEGAPE